MKRFLLLAAFAGLLSSAVWAQNHEGLIQYKQCLPCHGSNGEGKQNLKAPAIAGLPAWYILRQTENFQKGFRGKHPKDLPGMRMRAMAKTVQSQRMQPIADFVEAMPANELSNTVTGDVTAGEQHYLTCSACHGASAEGNKDLNAPPLKIMSDWYQVTQLKNFKSGLRGTHPEDINGATMVGMASILPDDQAIADVVAYINTLK